jgi:hypothetical protein
LTILLVFYVPVHKENGGATHDGKTSAGNPQRLKRPNKLRIFLATVPTNPYSWDFMKADVFRAFHCRRDGHDRTDDSDQRKYKVQDDILQKHR